MNVISVVMTVSFKIVQLPQIV
uniref:Uncharacterized protein n=1 Tax=Arundo donax TaxID=35708 RepID=A0A0A8ZHS2_ARUDO